MAENIKQIFDDELHKDKVYPVTVSEAVKTGNGRTLALELEGLGRSIKDIAATGGASVASAVIMQDGSSVETAIKAIDNKVKAIDPDVIDNLDTKIDIVDAKIAEEVEARTILAGDVAASKAVTDDLTDDNLTVRTMAHGYTKEEVWYRSNKFRELLNDGGVYDTFLFYSDPHMMFTGGSVMDYNLDAPILKKFSLIQKYAKTNPFSFVLDGGDWLNHTNPAANATQMLAWLAGTMPNIFPNYKFMLGNHDTNYQGVAKLSQGALNGILFNRYGGKSYYTFKTGVSRVYIFDTGVDDDNTMSAYKWEQIDWFANQLIANDDPYTIICGHIYRNAWAQNVASSLVQNIMRVVSAYNEKRAVMLNGIAYNFASNTGRVWAYFAGHKHSDYDLIDPIGGIPVVGVAKSMTLTDPNYKTTFDMIKVGYGENKIRCIRVGEGENRVIDIPAPATWQTIAPENEIPGWYLIGEYRCNQSVNDKLVKYAVTPGERLRINLAADTNGYVACQFQKTGSVSSGDASGQGGKAMYLKSTWVSGIYEVPDDCYYLIIGAHKDNTTDTVERIVK